MCVFGDGDIQSWEADAIFVCIWVNTAQVTVKTPSTQLYLYIYIYTHVQIQAAETLNVQYKEPKPMLYIYVRDNQWFAEHQRRQRTT